MSDRASAHSPQLLYSYSSARPRLAHRADHSVDAKKVIKRRLAQQCATKPEQEERAAMEVGKVAQQKGLLGVQSRALHEAEIIRHLDENHQSTMTRLKAQRDSQGKAPPTGSPSNGRAYQSRRETDSV